MIDEKVKELGDWRGETLARRRTMIKQADSEVIEEWKWRGVPVWSHDGVICTGETYKAVVKMTFAKGAALDDPSGLFNSSLEGSIRRAIDIREGEAIDENALKSLPRGRAAEHLHYPEAAVEVDAAPSGTRLISRPDSGMQRLRTRGPVPASNSGNVS